MCLILPNQSERGCSQREQEVGEQYVPSWGPQVGPQPPDSSGGLGPGPSHPAYTHSNQESGLPKVEVHRATSSRWSGMQLRLPGQRGGRVPSPDPTHIPRVAQGDKVKASPADKLSWGHTHLSGSSWGPHLHHLPKLGPPLPCWGLAHQASTTRPHLRHASSTPGTPAAPQG